MTVDKNIEPAIAWAVVPASGTGERFAVADKANADKLLAPLGGIPVLVRTLQALMSARLIAGVVIAAHPQKQAAYQAAVANFSMPKPMLWTAGGATRRESVMAGVAALPSEADIAVVHDAARPMITDRLIDQAIATLMAGDAAGVLVAIPARDTLKQVSQHDGHPATITQTLDRHTIWQAQTPQLAWRNKLTAAHQAVSIETVVTDDVQLLEIAGLGPVEVVTGSADNLKITTPADLLLAESWLAIRKQ